MRITRTPRRAVLCLATVAGLGLAAVGGVRAADPFSPAPNTLGAEVSAAVVADADPTAYVVNRGSVVMTFRAIAPAGWTVSPSDLTLRPGERGTFALSGAGDAGLMTITGAMVRPAGGDATAIRFGQIAVMQTRPFDPSRYLPGIGLGLLLAAGAVIALRRVRPWEYRIHRTTG